MTDQLLRQREAAARLAISERTLRRISKQELPWEYIGQRNRRYKESDVQAYIDRKFSPKSENRPSLVPYS